MQSKTAVLLGPETVPDVSTAVTTMAVGPPADSALGDLWLLREAEHALTDDVALDL